MKKYILILLALVMVMCKSKQVVAETPATPATPPKKQIQYRDDFRSVTDKERVAFLKKLSATGEAYSVLILTKGYKGESIKISNAKRTMYSGYPISNMKTGIAESIRIENGVDTKVYDNLTKKTVIIDGEEAKKHKFIYLMKDNSDKENPFTITYSNTLRPLK